MTNVEPDIVDNDDAPWPSAFGERLQLARESAGMSQDYVHKQLGYPVRSVTRWENGKCDPGFAKVLRMAELYGVSMDWIAGRTSVKQCIQAGMVMIDNKAIEVLEQLAAQGKTLADVPEHMIRRPGINYAVVVPADPCVVAPSAAARVEARMRSCWKDLGGEGV